MYAPFDGIRRSSGETTVFHLSSTEPQDRDGKTSSEIELAKMNVLRIE
jgi:hypothetical protein